MKLLKQPMYIRYALVKLSKFVQFCTYLPEDSLEIKKGLELVSRSYFHRIFSFVMLHKLAKIHDQTVFTSQVFQ